MIRTRLQLHSVARIAFCGVFLSSSATATEPQPTEFARFDAFTEGPVFDYEGNLFVSHGKSFVSKIAPDGTTSVWMTTDNPNGHKILPDGSHLLCIKGAVLHLAADGINVLNKITQCRGKPLRQPNDLTLASDGGFYFTDPGGSRDAPIGTVHYVDTQGAVHLAADGLRVPNGLVLSRDGSRLYVAETVTNRVLRFPVKQNGMLGESAVFAELPSKPNVTPEPDGLAIDTNGNVYVAHLGMSSVQVLNPQGQLIRTLPAGNYDASNLVFGGKDRNQLFVTGSIGHRSNSAGRVYRIDLPDVRGVSSLLPRIEQNDSKQPN